MSKCSVAEIPGRRHKLVRTQSLNCSFLYSIRWKTAYFGRFCRLIKTKRNMEYDLFLRKASETCINFRNSLKLCKGDRHFKRLYILKCIVTLNPVAYGKDQQNKPNAGLIN